MGVAAAGAGAVVPVVAEGVVRRVPVAGVPEDVAVVVATVEVAAPEGADDGAGAGPLRTTAITRTIMMIRPTANAVMASERDLLFMKSLYHAAPAARFRIWKPAATDFRRAGQTK